MGPLSSNVAGSSREPFTSAIRPSCIFDLKHRAVFSRYVSRSTFIRWIRKRNYFRFARLYHRIGRIISTSYVSFSREFSVIIHSSFWSKVSSSGFPQLENPLATFAARRRFSPYVTSRYIAFATVDRSERWSVSIAIRFNVECLHVHRNCMSSLDPAGDRCRRPSRSPVQGVGIIRSWVEAHTDARWCRPRAEVLRAAPKLSESPRRYREYRFNSS